MRTTEVQSAGPEKRHENPEYSDEQSHDQHVREVIDILTWTAPYRWSKNTNVAEKKLLWVFKRLLPIEIVSAVLITAMRKLEDHHLLNLSVGFWSLAFSVIAWIGMGTGALVVVRALWILWRRRAYLVQDQGRHIQDAYLLHNGQARLLARYPVTVLEGVSRFYEKRPFVVQGLYSTLFGGNTLTLASVGALFGLVKGFFDLHALGPADSDFRVDLWIGLFVLLSIAAIARWVRAKGDYERVLLTEAIVLASIREGGTTDTGPTRAVT